MHRDTSGEQVEIGAALVDQKNFTGKAARVESAGQLPQLALASAPFKRTTAAQYSSVHLLTRLQQFANAIDLCLGPREIAVEDSQILVEGGQLRTAQVGFGGFDQALQL